MSLRAHFHLIIASLLAAGPLLAVTDPFDDDPADPGSDWELYEPIPGATYSIEDGWWRVVVPAGTVLGTNLDHWVTIDQAIQLRRSDVPEDFIIETRLRFLGSGNPDAPTWPPANESYQVGLMVYFSVFDMFYWGPYRGTNLRVERAERALRLRSGAGRGVAPDQEDRIGVQLQLAGR